MKAEKEETERKQAAETSTKELLTLSRAPEGPGNTLAKYEMSNDLWLLSVISFSSMKLISTAWWEEQVALMKDDGRRSRQSKMKHGPTGHISSLTCAQRICIGSNTSRRPWTFPSSDSVAASRGRQRRWHLLYPFPLTTWWAFTFLSAFQ